MRQFQNSFLASSMKQAEQEMLPVRTEALFCSGSVCLFVFQVSDFSRFSLSNLKSIEFFSFSTNNEWNHVAHPLALNDLSSGSKYVSSRKIRSKFLSHIQSKMVLYWDP